MVLREWVILSECEGKERRVRGGEESEGDMRECEGKDGRLKEVLRE